MEFMGIIAGSRHVLDRLWTTNGHDKISFFF